MATTTTRTKPLGKVSSYLKNVGKSVGYASVNAITNTTNGYMSNTADFIDTNKDLFKDIYGSVRNYKETARQIDKAIRQNKTFQAIDAIKNSTIEDLKTGQFYNPERENKMAIEAMGDDFADLLKDDWGISDYDFSDSNSSNYEDKDTFLAQKEAQAYAAASAGNAKTVSSAIGMSAEYTGEAIRASSKAQMAHASQLQTALSKQMNESLNIIHHDLKTVTTFLNKPLVTHMQNSQKFYENTTKILTEQNAMMKEMLEMQRNLYKKEQDDYYVRSSYSKVGGTGAPDLANYGKEIGKNAKRLLAESGLDMLFDSESLGMGEGSNMLKMFAGSPLSIIPTFIVKSMMPNTLKKSMKKFDKAIGTFFDGMIANLNNYSKSGNNNLMRMVSDLFGLKIYEKHTVDMSNFNKGSTPWNGLAQKSLVEVIPTYLRRIEAALTGNEERIWDPESGKWKGISVAKREFKQLKQNAVRSGTYEVNSWLEKGIGLTNKTEAEKSRAYQTANLMMDILYEDNGVVKTNQADKYYRRIKSKNKNVSLADVELLLELLDKNRDVVRNATSNVMRSKERYSNTLNDIEHNVGSTQYSHVLNGSMAGMGNSIIGNNGRSSNGNSKGRKAKQYVDEYAYEDYTYGERINKAMNKIKKDKSKKGEVKKDLSALGLSDAQIAQMIKEASYDDDDSDFMNQFAGKAKNARNNLFDKLLHATSIGDKWKVLMDSIDNLTSKPAEYLTSVLTIADNRMYDMLFKGRSGEVDEDGNPIDSVTGVMINQIKKEFNKFDKWIDEHILEKLKKKFEESETGQKIIGTGKKLFSATRGKLSNAGRWAGGNLRDVYDEAGGVVRRTFSKKQQGYQVPSEAEMQNMSAMDYDSIYLQGKAKGGSIKKTGLYALSKGEMVVPSESNPFYNGPTNKRQQIANEKAVIKNSSSKVLGSFAEGTPNAEKGLFGEFFREVFGVSNEKAENTKSTSERIIKEIGKTAKADGIDTASSGIAGAIIGAGGSLLTGLAGGPIIGAAIGVGSSLIKRSKFLNELVFGKVGENGERDNSGLIKKDQQNLINKYMPDMAKYGLAGGVVSLVTPLGLVGGLMAGSAFGWAKNNDKFKEYFFGTKEDPDSGVFKKEFQDKIKQHAPSIVKGAGAGAVASLFGPFGIIGGAMMGAGLGLVTSTDSFRDMLLGKYNEKSKQMEGGVAGALREGVVDPLKDSMTGFADKLNTGLDKFVLQPLKDFVEPVGQLVQNTVKDVSWSAKRIANNITMKLFKVPAEDVLKSVTGVLGKVLKVGLGGALAVKTAPVSIPALLGIGGAKLAGDTLRTSQIKRGTATNMTAAQRLEFRQKHNLRFAGKGLSGDKSYQMDTMLAGMDQNRLQNLVDSSQEYIEGEAAGSTRFAEVMRQNQRDAKSYLRSTESESFDPKRPDNVRKEKLIDIFGNKNMILLDKAIADGDLEAVSRILNYPGKGGRTLSNNDQQNIMNIVEGRTSAVKLYRDKLKNKKREKSDIQKELSKMTGRSIKSDKDVRYYLDYAKTELASRQKATTDKESSIIASMTPGENEINKSINDVGDRIVKALQLATNIIAKMNNSDVSVEGKGFDSFISGKRHYNANGVTENQASDAAENVASGLASRAAISHQRVTETADNIQKLTKAYRMPIKAFKNIDLDPQRVNDVCNLKHKIVKSAVLNVLAMANDKDYKRFINVAKKLDSNGIGVNAKLASTMFTMSDDAYKSILLICKSKYKFKSADEANTILTSMSFAAAQRAVRAMKNLKETPKNISQLFGMADAGISASTDRGFRNNINNLAESSTTGVPRSGVYALSRGEAVLGNFATGTDTDENSVSGGIKGLFNKTKKGILHFYKGIHPFFTDAEGHKMDDSQTKQTEDIANKDEADDKENATGITKIKNGISSIFEKFFNKKNKESEDKDENNGGIFGKLLGFSSKLKKWLGIGAAIGVGIPMLGHLSEWAKDKLVPVLSPLFGRVKTWLVGGKDEITGEQSEGVLGKLKTWFETSGIKWICDGFSEALSNIVVPVTTTLIQCLPKLVVGIGKGVWNAIKNWNPFEKKLSDNNNSNSNDSFKDEIDTLNSIKSQASAKKISTITVNNPAGDTSFNVNSYGGGAGISSATTSENSTSSNYITTTDANGNTVAVPASVVQNKEKSIVQRAGSVAGRGFINGLSGFSGSGISKIMGTVSEKLGKSALTKGGFLSRGIKGLGSIVTGASGIGDTTYNIGSSIRNAGLEAGGKDAELTAQAFSKNGTGLTSGLKNLVSGAKDKMSNTISSAKSKVSDLLGIGKKAATESADNVADAAANAVTSSVTSGGSKGILTKITSGLKTIFNKLAESTIGSKILKAVASATSKETTQEALKKVFGKAIDKLATGSVLGKVASDGLSKICGAIGSFSPLGIALLLTDFMTGWSNADTIFGVAKSNKYTSDDAASKYSVGTLQKVVAGLVTILTNRFTLGFIPASTLIDIFLDYIAPLFKIDTSKLNAARADAQDILDAWNANNPDEQYSTLEDYNNKDKWTTKLKKAVSRTAKSAVKKIKSAGSKLKNYLTNLFVGSDRSDNNKEEAEARAEKNKLYDNIKKTNGGSARFIGSHYYQKDPSIANKSYGGSTIGKNGCAPVAAANLLRSLRGQGSDVDDAASYASSNGYANKNGTKIDYFTKYLGSKGYNSAKTNNPVDVAKALKNGQKAVLLGQDSGGAVSPYSTNPHFITATGMDRSGNIIVEDPDLPNKTMAYPAGSVLGNMSSSVVVNGQKRGKSRIHGLIRGRGASGVSSVNAMDVVNIAKKEINTSEAGNSNKVKYNTAYYGKAVSGASYPWCVTFIWWCFNQAGASSLFYGGGQTASSGALLKYYKKNNQITTDPEPGDIAFFNFSGYPTPQHVGIVSSIPSDTSTIVTIEGNTGGSGVAGETNGGYVKEKTRSKSLVIAFARPAFADAGSVVTSSDSSSSGNKLLSAFSNLGTSLLKKMYGTSGENIYNTLFGSNDNDSSDSNITAAEMSGSDSKQKLWNYLKKQGYNDYGAAGIMGNLDAESGVQSDNVENGKYNKKYGGKLKNSAEDVAYTNAVDNGKISESQFKNDKFGYGLAQWTSSNRRDSLYKATKGTGLSISDLGAQASFLNSELNSYGLANKLKNATSVQQASDYVLKDFEKPANADQKSSTRASKGLGIYNLYKGTDASSSSDTGSGRSDAAGYLRTMRSSTRAAIMRGQAAAASTGNYTEMLKAIVQVLVQISDDTDQLNTVVTLLKSQGGSLAGMARAVTANDSTGNKANAAKSKLKSFASDNTTGSSSMGSIFSNKDTDYILKAMSSLASE